MEGVFTILSGHPDGEFGVHGDGLHPRTGPMDSPWQHSPSPCPGRGSKQGTWVVQGADTAKDSARQDWVPTPGHQLHMVLQLCFLLIRGTLVS